MDLDWKRSGQDKALEFTDGNMLVSASAGSGKTTVMVEKIKRYIAAGGSLKRLVVVTFTRASAEDMREKIEIELKELIRRTGEERYKNELRALPIAYIGTVDSLCSSIYKKYFEDVGGPPSFKVLEEDESRELLREASDTVLELKLATGDANFAEFLHHYAGIDPAEGFFNTVSDVFSYLDTRRDPEEFLEKAYENAGLPFDESPAVKYLTGTLKDKIAAYLSELPYHYERAETAAAGRRESLKNILSYYETALRPFLKAGVKELYDLVNAFKTQRRPGTSDKYSAAENESLKTVSLYIGRLNDLIKDAKTVFTDYETARSDEAAVMTDIKTVLESVREVSEKYYELKLKEGAFDFSDVERLALKILSDPERAREFSDDVDYIFFDEYQDINPLQEAIINAISKDNVFMVGDVKQSIYRFRHAEPKLFLKRYGEYAEGRSGKNVPLNMNFRSSQPILDFSDRIFSKIMTPTFGGVDYDSEARFNEAGLEIPPLSFKPVEVRFFEKPKKADPALPPFYRIAEGDTVKESRDPEAEYIADDILQSVGHEEIPAKGGFRKMRFSDIAVLVRDKNTAARFAAEFEKRGIPYDAEFPSLADTGDIVRLTAFLKVIDNPYQDFPLAAAMSSAEGGFSESELYELSRSGEGKFFYERAYSAPQSAVKEKFDRFMADIARYRKLAAVTDVPTLINAIAAERGFITAMASSPKRLSYYNAYLKHISTREASSELGRFLKWTDSEEVAPKTTGSGQGVSILTIHKSKGLEFPSVYLPATERTFRQNAKKQKTVPDGELGLGLNVFDDDSGTATRTLNGIAIERKTIFEEKQEESRLMYVAMTRARYRLRVTGMQPAREREVTYPEEAVSMRQWIKMAAADDAVLEGLVTVCDCGEATEEVKPIEIPDSPEPEISFFEYPYAAACKVANKYTVTALNTAKEQERDAEEGQHTPSLGAQEAETGILFHKIMEKVDLSARGIEACERELVRLKEEGIDVSGMTGETLNRILSLSVFDGVGNATVLRKKEFIYYVPANEVLDTECTDPILVQGVIDLAIIGEDGTVLVDYKVSGASHETLKSRYSKQLELYSKALYEATGKYPDKRYIVLINRGEALEI